MSSKSLSGKKTSVIPPPLTSDLWAGWGVVLSNQSQEGSVKPTVAEGSVVSGMMCLIPSFSIFLHSSSSTSSLLSLSPTPEEKI